MYGKVEMTVKNPVERGERFSAHVEVSGAEPGSHVTVMLDQKRGVEPFAPPQARVVLADDMGIARTSFEISLEGPARASLMSRAYDARGPHYEPDVESVEVRG